MSCLLDERTSEELNDGVLRDRLVHDLRVRIGVPMDGPEDDRLDDESGGDGRVRHGLEHAAAHTFVEVPGEEPDETTPPALEPQCRQLGKVACRTVEQP